MRDEQSPTETGPGSGQSGDPATSAGQSALTGLTTALGIEPARPGHDPLLGCDIGGVTITRLIAEGGMGRVYEGKQDKPNRIVAVKVMRPGLTSPSVLKRFEYEAEVLGRLQHPGIAHIYSVGVHRVGAATVPYFVMEYIPEAKSLTAYVEELKLATRQRLDLFRSVCDAVAHGHQKGVIHRDLKPSNILVDASGQPKVIDFGVARATDSDMALTTMQTDVGQLIGTLQYMSPEQLDADPNDIDVRSDVYALGVVLYELLAGKPPYDVKKKAVYEVMRIVKEEEPTPLSSLNKTLRRDVGVIAGKCLEKDRGRRYSSASELSSDISRHLAGEAILAAPPSLWESVARLALKHRVAALFSTILLATLLIAIVAISVFAAHAERERRTADRVLGFFSDTLQTSNPRSQGKPMSLANVLRDAHRRLLAQESIDDRAKAVILTVLARSFLGLGLYEDAGSASAAAYDLFATLDGLATPAALEARCLELEAELSRADSSADRVVLLGEQLLAERTVLFGERHPATIEAMSNLAVAYRSSGQLEKAIVLGRNALQLRSETAGASDRETLLAINNLAVSLRKADRNAEAIALYTSLLPMAERALPKDDPDTLLFFFNSAVAQFAAKNFTAALEMFSRVYEARRSRLGSTHPETLDALVAYARVLVKVNKPLEARELLQPVLSLLDSGSEPELRKHEPLMKIVTGLFVETL